MWRRIVKSKEPTVMTNLIIVETVTLLRRRAGFDQAKRAGERMLSGAVGEVVHVLPALLDAAWALFLQYDDQELSLVDCVSFAFMRQRSITHAFTFDDDFRTMGFPRP